MADVDATINSPPAFPKRYPTPYTRVDRHYNSKVR
jgi:hypothetical protein